MNPREIKQFCQVVSAACARGELTKKQAKTLQGQAKHGDYRAALRGLQTIYNRM